MRIDFANKKIIITPEESKILDDGGAIELTVKGKQYELVTFDLLDSYKIITKDEIKQLQESELLNNLGFLRKIKFEQDNVTETYYINKSNDIYFNFIKETK